MNGKIHVPLTGNRKYEYAASLEYNCLLFEFCKFSLIVIVNSRFLASMTSKSLHGRLVEALFLILPFLILVYEWIDTRIDRFLGEKVDK